MNNGVTAGMVARTTLNDLPTLAAQSLHERADHMVQLIGFHSLYRVPMRQIGSEDCEFRHMDDERVALRLGLILEEVKELLEDGFGVKVDMEFSHRDCNDGFPVRVDRLAEVLAATGKRDGVEVADASGDIVYVLYGMMLEMGFDLGRVIEEIHASNLTKLGEDGKPIYREDGKVLKGPNYVKPNIAVVLGFDGDRANG